MGQTTTTGVECSSQINNPDASECDSEAPAQQTRESTALQVVREPEHDGLPTATSQARVTSEVAHLGKRRLQPPAIERVTLMETTHAPRVKPSASTSKRAPITASNEDRLMKKMKNGSTCSPDRVDAGSTAWCRDGHASRVGHETHWCGSVDDDATEHEPVATYWSSKLSGWVVDLTQAPHGSSGSTTQTTSSCGAKDGCALVRKTVRMTTMMKAGKATAWTTGRRSSVE
ncbi:hypothetical protein GN244_ATG16554 [Phytophthora infestans]|uniref:Uncharacterized protein n=1 Tax=Phytophthora infestans TaxID=4787 RepID=A0A833WF34_PHYIN|nr:hypothetical protein GN244_ATG16554 [Phytophthora infestans]KAF4143756.1 hypothetical protein GN958_ATG07052 [Phytophthora infestans]